MGLIAHFSYPVPGNLPSLHICQGWAAPLPCRTHPREGRGRPADSLSPLSHRNKHLPPPPPLLVNHLAQDHLLGQWGVLNSSTALCQFGCLTLHLAQLIGSQRSRASPSRQEELAQVSQDEGFRRKTSLFKLGPLHFLQRFQCFHTFVFSPNSSNSPARKMSLSPFRR